MHYYKFNIGDYRRRTSQLNLLEHGIYRHLVDEYYLDEKPLPCDINSIYWKIGARTEEEKNATQNILKNFFVLTKKGHTHKHCDDLIAEYKGKSLKNKENGAKGGRPKNKPKKTQSVVSENPSESQNNPNQEPLTTNHKPLTNSNKRKTSFALTELIELHPDIDRQVLSDFVDHRKSKKAPITKTAWNGICREVEKVLIISKGDFMNNSQKIVKAMGRVWHDSQLVRQFGNLDSLQRQADTYNKFLKNIEDSDIEKAIDEIAAEKLRRVDFMVFPDFVEFARIVKSVSKRRIDYQEQEKNKTGTREVSEQDKSFARSEIDKMLADFN